MNMSPLANLPDLETDRLRLRKLRHSDAEALFAYARNPEVTQYTSWSPHTSLADSVAFLDATIPSYAQPAPEMWTWAIALRSNDYMIGTFALFGRVQHYNAELGYAIGRDYWGLGYVPEAARAVLKFAFTGLGLNRIQAICFVPNIASARVMEKVGMTFEGILRDYVYYKDEFHDSKIYSILKKEYDEQQNQDSAR